MKLYEINPKLYRRLFTINNSFDVGLSSIFDMELMLIESKKIIYEDHNDVKIFKNFIQTEKSNTIDIQSMVPGNIYYPIQYRAAPFQQTVILDVPSADCKFISKDSNSLYFTCKRRKLQFVNPTTAVGVYTTLIFNNKYDADQHKTAFMLKFGNWDIKIKTI